MVMHYFFTGESLLMGKKANIRSDLSKSYSFQCGENLKNFSSSVQKSSILKERENITL